MMLTILLPALLTLVSPTTSLSLPPTISLQSTYQQQQQQQQQQQPILFKPATTSNKPLATHFRPATESDLLAITTITVEAFSPSAAWHYLIPDTNSHKKQIWTCLHDQIAQGWKHFDRNKTFLNVITVPLEDDSDDSNEDSKGNSEKETPVSFAVWNLRTLSEGTEAASSSPFFSIPSLLQTCIIPPGTNLTRAQDYKRQVQPVEQKYFFPSEESVWQGQLYLNLLATHPDWDGNGFGARQVRWGLELSREYGVEDAEVNSAGEKGGEAKGTIPVTLLATPAGWPLYESLGFEGVENATIGMLDGLGDLWFEVCKWDGFEVD
jgi:hypothetical protein